MASNLPEMFSYLPIIRFLAGRRRQCRFRKTKNNMIVAYLRVSTGKQNLANQQDEIRRFAESRELVITNWVTEVVSGKAKEKDRKTRTVAEAHEEGRHADRDGNIPPRAGRVTTHYEVRTTRYGTKVPTERTDRERNGNPTVT